MTMEIKAIPMTEELKMMRGVQGVQEVIPRPNDSSVDKTQQRSFGDFMVQQLEEVNSSGLEADKKVQDALQGKEVNPHETLIALQKADVTFQLLMAVKERVVQAYQQVIRTPIG